MIGKGEVFSGALPLLFIFSGYFFRYGLMQFVKASEFFKVDF